MAMAEFDQVDVNIPCMPGNGEFRVVVNGIPLKSPLGVQIIADNDSLTVVILRIHADVRGSIEALPQQ